MIINFDRNITINPLLDTLIIPKEKKNIIFKHKLFSLLLNNIIFQSHNIYISKSTQNRLFKELYKVWQFYKVAPLFLTIRAGFLKLLTNSEDLNLFLERVLYYIYSRKFNAVGVVLTVIHLYIFRDCFYFLVEINSSRLHQNIKHINLSKVVSFW